jgi:hypothetical protein
MVRTNTREALVYIHFLNFTVLLRSISRVGRIIIDRRRASHRRRVWLDPTLNPTFLNLHRRPSSLSPFTAKVEQRSVQRLSRVLSSTSSQATTAVDFHARSPRLTDRLIIPHGALLSRFNDHDSAHDMTSLFFQRELSIFSAFFALFRPLCDVNGRPWACAESVMTDERMCRTSSTSAP